MSSRQISLKLLWLILLAFHGFYSPLAWSCDHPINPNLEPSTIDVQGTLRTYIVTGCADHQKPKGLPIILSFHAGGGVLHTSTGTGFIDYTGLASAPALVVFPIGNPSWNNHSWMSAFPWMKSNLYDDYALVEQLLIELKRRSELPKVNLEEIFAVGKSDGAGFALSLTCNPVKTYTLAGVAVVSGAYFGLGSVNAFGASEHAICLPVSSTPILMIHGTGDSVMPFEGQPFLNARALAHSGDFWSQIDPSVTSDSSNTFTADISGYAEAIALGPEACKQSEVERVYSNSLRTNWMGCKAPFATIWVTGGNHVWMGHSQSGPGSGKPPNMDFDATNTILEFFGIHP